MDKELERGSLAGNIVFEMVRAKQFLQSLQNSANWRRFVACATWPWKVTRRRIPSAGATVAKAQHLFDCDATIEESIALPINLDCSQSSWHDEFQIQIRLTFFEITQAVFNNNAYTSWQSFGLQTNLCIVSGGISGFMVLRVLFENSHFNIAYTGLAKQSGQAIPKSCS